MRDHIGQANGTRGEDKGPRTAEMPRDLAPDNLWADNSTALLEPVEACVHSLIKRVVWEHPSAPAICSWDGDLTYQQLDQVSSRLAHRLVEAGIKPRTTVVLCFEKTWLAPVAVLALMKAGAISVALDMGRTREELRSFITTQISAPVVLSSPASQKAAQQLGVTKVIVVDEGMLSVPTTASFPLPTVAPSDAICVLRCDAGAGAGAVVTHRELSSAITYQQRALGVTSNSRAADLEFYNSRVAWYILLTLACGGCLCIPSPAALRDDIEKSILAVRANYALLPPKSEQWSLDYTKLRFIQLKDSAGVVTPLHLKDLTVVLSATASSDALTRTIALPTANGHTSKAHADDSHARTESRACNYPENNHCCTENGRAEDAHRANGHTKNGPTKNGCTKNDPENGHPGNCHEENRHQKNGHTENGQAEKGLESGESHVKSGPGEIWLQGWPIHSQILNDNNARDRVLDDTEEHPRLDDNASCEPAIPPFSLLSPYSPAEQAQSRGHAARLCNVLESQVLDILPCTPLQQGLLALTTKRPGDYVARNVFDVAEDIDTDRFQWAWDEVVARNPILRTRIISLPGPGVVQVVLDNQVPWTLGTDHNNDLEQNRNGQHMGLSTPLTKFALFKSAAGGHRQFVWEIHHALYDGFALPLLLKQVEDIYFGNPTQALQPMTSFIKYIIDQDKATSKNFWQRLFADTQGTHFPPPKTAHHPRPDCQMSLTVSDLNWGRGDFTPSTIIRAAWSVAAANGAGTNEALFGVTVTGRQAPVPGIELMAGPAIATLPIRVALRWDDSFSQLLKAVQSQAVEMIPFEQTGLQRIARFSEETALGSAFQTLLVVQPTHQGGSDDDGAFLSESTKVQSDGTQWQDFSTYAIVIECQLESDKVHLRIAFDSSIIGQQQMEHTAHKLKYALGQLSNSRRSDQPLRILLDDHWALDRIWTWNAVVPKSTDACIHDLISQRAREQPLAPAINAWDGDLTYGELEDLSTTLAHYLSSRGVAGTVVPLLFEKSKFMSVAALAVMKAGGASVALDIKQPLDRLCAITAQANSPIILSSEKNESLARRVTTGMNELVILGLNQQLPVSSPFRLPPVSPADILYVVFTSGTTGTPKGVAITHGNFSTAITYQQKELGFSNTSRVFDFASYAFDAAWCNLLHALTVGGTLCIPSQSELENELPSCLERYKATTVDLTPSVARIVGRTALSKLTTLILGGEAVLLDDAYLANEKTRIINVYGPAECTPTATLAEVKATGIGIGYGAGVCTWVVDPENPGSLSPIGSVGELYLEGPLVGRGYLNDPEKTAAAFVEDPAWLLRGVPDKPDRPGRPGRHGRLYRTGDLVRYQEDGSLVFVGRKDTQVKIRGQRVELGEVEQHVLDALRPLLPLKGSNAANIQITAETFRPKESISTILIAFVTFDYAGDRYVTEESHADVVRQVTDTLTARLTEKLPIYMVPTAFVPIYKVPTTTTGKTDRRQLRAIGESVYLQLRNIADDNDEPTEPLNQLETILQQIWMSVLNVSAREATLNKAFTRLGGDSISAMQAVSQGRLHNIAFTVGDLLKAGTIRKLAAQCQIISRHGPAIEDMHEDTDDGASFELSPIQQMFFDAYPEVLNHFNQSFVLELRHMVPTATLSSALHALLLRHSLLRARYSKNQDSGLWMQTIAEEGDVQSFAFAEHFLADRNELTAVGQLRQESFDIQHGPLFACDLFIVPDGNQILMLSAHHLVIDLVSWRIVWNDLEEFIAHGKLLSRPTTSFRTWCRRQAKISRNLSPLSVLPYQIPEPQIDFWGLPSPANTFANCEVYSEIYDEQVSAAVFGDANDALRTEPVDIIVGAMIYSFLHTFPERAAPVIWIEGHGRDQSPELPLDVSGTVGWFTTIYPLPVAITLESSIFDAIRIAKDNRTNVPGKGLPYFSCRYHSESGREAFKNHDVVEIMFNFTGRYQQLEGDDSLFMRPEHLDDVEGGIVDVAESARRLTMIDINADVEENKLAISFTVHRNMKHQDRLRAWTESFSQSLVSVTRDLIQSSPSFTLSDLPLLPLSYSGLDTLLLEQLPSMGIKMSDIADIYPCSPLQEGILLSSEKETATYATFSVWKCVPTDATAPISTSRLETAWKAVVSRHTILQSVFSLHPESGGFIQIVLPGSNIRVAHIAAELDDPAAVLGRIERPIFAANEPQHAFTICQSNTGEVACRLDANHSLIDASSMSVIVQDIISVYDNCDISPAPRFSEMIRYINTIARAEIIASWTKLLDGVEPCEFPTCRRRPGQTTVEDNCDISIPANMISGIAGFCKKLAITRSVFLQVAWAMALSHLTGMSDVCFGYLASGRDSPVDGIETMVGPLANLLVSRIDLRQSARQVLETTSDKSIQHLSIQHASLAEIQHQLGLSGRRLFNTALSIREADKFTSNEERSISFESRNGEDPHEYDLSLSANIDGNSMDIVMEFRAPYVSQHAAHEASTILGKAIQYLLAANIDDTDNHTSEESLIEGFFKHLVGADEQSTRSFWETQFINIQGSHFPTPKAATYQPQPDKEVRMRLREPEWANRGGFAAATVLRATWSILTTRILGSNEALFGATATNHDELLPVRISIDSEATVTDLLEAVQLQASKMAAFEKSGLQRIRSISEEASFGCDFQTLLHVTDQLSSEPERRHSTHVHEFQQGSSTYAMIIECHLEHSETDIVIQYDSNVIGELQATRISQQFEHVLHQLLHLDLREEKLKTLTVATPHDISDIWTWNSTVPEPVEACVHELIIQRAREQPLALATSAWDGNLTYKQLLELSTNLARELVKRGVGPGTIVPLCFEKSMWMPVAALAVIQTGAAAVALDSASQPEERIRAIAVHVKAKVILSSVANESLAHRIGINEVVVVGPARFSIPGSVQADETNGHVTNKCCELPISNPSNILYVIFTSGSTGAPKGVKISHRNFCSAIAYQRDALGYTESSRVLDFSSYAFDVFWSNLLNTLTAGACICIPSSEERQDDLSGCLEKYKITLADFTPSIARHTTGLSNLSTLVLGGEVVLPTDMYLASENAKVKSAYGPAECTPTATILDITSVGDVGLGRGAGVCTWVVEQDDPTSLAAIGAIGELWIEGPLVGEGYLDDPKRTAAVFIQDPPWLLGGVSCGRRGRRGRVYRTGDLVQYRDDGSLLFVGRKDTQVKVRGQRVELEEVEHYLEKAMGNSAQVVAETIQPHGAESPILAAFVAIVGAGEDYNVKIKQATAGVSSRLAEVLPPFMVPTVYIPLQGIPRMTTGKLDRRQLRAIGSKLTSKDIARLSRVDGERRAPQSHVEQLIQGLWAEVLKIDTESISIDDSFFRMGGDSIGAMRLVGIARQRGLSLTIRDIFRNPVLRDLAAVYT